MIATKAATPIALYRSVLPCPSGTSSGTLHGTSSSSPTTSVMDNRASFLPCNSSVRVSVRPIQRSWSGGVSLWNRTGRPRHFERQLRPSKNPFDHFSAPCSSRLGFIHALQLQFLHLVVPRGPSFVRTSSSFPPALHRTPWIRARDLVSFQAFFDPFRTCLCVARAVEKRARACKAVAIVDVGNPRLPRPHTCTCILTPAADEDTTIAHLINPQRGTECRSFRIARFRFCSSLERDPLTGRSGTPRKDGIGPSIHW